MNSHCKGLFGNVIYLWRLVWLYCCPQQLFAISLIQLRSQTGSDRYYLFIPTNKNTEVFIRHFAPRPWRSKFRGNTRFRTVLLLLLVVVVAVVVGFLQLPWSKGSARGIQGGDLKRLRVQKGIGHLAFISNDHIVNYLVLIRCFFGFLPTRKLSPKSKTARRWDLDSQWFHSNARLYYASSKGTNCAISRWIVTHSPAPFTALLDWISLINLAN